MTNKAEEWKPQHGLSAAGLAFLLEHHRLIDLLYFITRVCAVYETVEQKYPQLLDSITGHGVPGDALPSKPIDILVGKHLVRLNQMLFCRCVDAFLLYVSDVVGEIFRARPECLRSSEKVEVQEVLRHKDMGSLIEALGARKVETLSYQGAREVCDYLADKLGLAASSDPTNVSTIVVAVEKRNLVVHARGVVSARFRERTGQTIAEGTQLSFSDLAAVYGEMQAIREVAVRIDDEACGKFGIAAKAG